MKEIKIRYQLSKNYQVVEVEATIPVEEVKETKERLLALATTELDKIANIGQSAPNTGSFTPKTASNNSFKQDPYAIATTSKGFDATSADKVKLTNGEVAKIRANKLKFWELTKAQIDAL